MANFLITYMKDSLTVIKYADMVALSIRMAPIILGCLPMVNMRGKEYNMTRMEPY